MQEKTDSSSVPPPTMSIVEQVESNMRNLQNLVLGAENLLRTKSIQEGASPMALEQLRASLEAAKEKMMEAANIRGIIKRHAYAQERRRAEKRHSLSKEELEKWSGNIARASVGENSNYRGTKVVYHREKFARTREQWNSYALEAVAPCRADWTQFPPALIGNVGRLMHFGIFLKETTTTGHFYPYAVRVFGAQEDVQYWSWSKYYIFRLLSERAQAALGYYLERIVYTEDTVEKGLDALLFWLLAHERLEEWQLSWDMTGNSFVPACIRSFKNPLQVPARHPRTCLSPKHRKMNSFIGIHSS